MPSVNRLLTKSLAATITPETAEFRRKELEGIPNPLTRAVALKINDLVANNPGRVAALLGIDYQPRPLKVLGQGWHSVVLPNGEGGVVKVNQGTLLLTAAERADFIEKKRHEHDVMAEYLGSFALPQEIFAATHPVFHNREVVETTQPRMRFVDPGIFYRDCTANSIATSVYDVQTSHPEAAAQLTEYIERSRTLYDNTGLLPDSCGAGNLVWGIPNGGFIMIDGQPIGRDEENVQHAILENLDHLEVALA